MKEKKVVNAGQKTIPPRPAPVMSSKIIRKRSGETLRQYPADPGYHGSGDETQLNPEE